MVAAYDESLSVDTYDELPTLSVDLGAGPDPLPPDVASRRAYKIQYGNLDIGGKTYQQIYDTLLQGNEKDLRGEATANLNLENLMKQQESLTRLARSEAPVNLRTITDATVRHNTDNNPNTVFEEAFSKRYLQALYGKGPSGTWFEEALKVIPKPVENTLVQASDVIKWHQYAVKLREDAEQNLKRQNWFNWSFGLGLQFIPFYRDIKLRGNVPIEGIGLIGSSLEAQAKALIQLPDREARLVTILDNLKEGNPWMAVEFARAVEGLTTSDVYLDNTFNLIDLTVVGAPFARAAKLFNQTRTTAKQMVKSVAETESTGGAAAYNPYTSIFPEGYFPPSRDVSRPITPEQLEMFGRPPDQGSFRFMGQRGEQVAPTLEEKLPPGKLRATYQPTTQTVEEAAKVEPKVVRSMVTGRMERNPTKQGEFDLPVSQHQATFDFGAAAPRARTDPLDEKIYEGMPNPWGPASTRFAMDDTPRAPIPVETVSPHRMAPAAAGDLAGSATIKATAEEVAKIANAHNPALSALEGLPTILRMIRDGITANPGRGGAEIANRLGEQFNVAIGNLQDIILNTIKVEKIPAALATEKVVKAIKDYMRDLYPGLNNHVLDIKDPQWNSVTNTVHTDMILGRNSGEFFASEAEALAVAEIHGILNPVVQQQGLGHYIRLTKPINIREQFIRDGALATDTAKAPESWLPSLVQKIRTGDDTLSVDQTFNRKTATYAPARYLETIKEDADKVIRDVKARFRGQNWFEVGANIGKWKDFQKTISESARSGKFFKGEGDLSIYYQRNFGRVPDPLEIEGYFAYVRNVEVDKVLREINVARNIMDAGGETHRIVVKGADGSLIKSNFFHGMVKSKAPGGNDSYVLIGKTLGEEKYGKISELGVKVETAIAEGKLRLIEVWKPEELPLSGFGSISDIRRPRYVITSQVETKPIEFGNLVPRGGPLVEYEYPWAIKQAKMTQDVIGKAITNWYNGDRNLMNIMDKAIGVKFVKNLNDAREFLKAGKIDEARAVLNPAIPFKDFEDWFKTSIGPDGKTLAPRLSFDEPLYLVDSKTMVGDLKKDITNFETRYAGKRGEETHNFRNGTREGSAAAQYQVNKTGDPDIYEIYTIKDRGSRYKPLYSYEPSQTVDPITTMNRGLGQIIQSTFLDDYKIYSVETWLQRAATSLKATPEEIKAAPFHVFSEITPASFRAGVTSDEIGNFMNEYAKIKQLMGTPSDLDSSLHAASQALADTIYSTFGPGPEVFGKRVLLAPAYTWGSLKDAEKFARSFAYHSTIGMFNHTQMVVQSMTWTNIAALSPQHVMQSVKGTVLHQMSRINSSPEVLAYLDRLASKTVFGKEGAYKPGQFLEARQGAINTGFLSVGSEHTLMDFAQTPRVISHAGRELLDGATWFFREAERNLRMGAWYAAYREFRVLKPNGRITNQEWQGILNRADLMSGNMSKASKSVIQEGAFAWPTQFLSYQLRLAEQMIGKRLTGVEKARILGLNAALFGVPTTMGVYGFPFGDYFRQYAMYGTKEGSYRVGDNWLHSLIMEGFPALATAFVTGGGDTSKGNWYGYGQRFGAPGFDIIRDTLSSDKGWYHIVGGAAWSKLGEILEAAYPFYQFIGSMFRDDDKAVRLTPDSWVGVAKVANSVNTLWKTDMAANYGVWLSKKNTLLDTNVSVANAFFMGLLGVQPTHVTDIRAKKMTLSGRESQIEFGKKMFQEEWRKGQDLHIRDGMEKASPHYQNAYNYLKLFDVPIQMYKEIFPQAMKNFETLSERLDWNIEMKNVPDSEKLRRLDERRRRLQIELGR